jgi:hypothetical protein
LWASEDFGIGNAKINKNMGWCSDVRDRSMFGFDVTAEYAQK